jgi:hypothetical protein
MYCYIVRLACVKLAASVRSEPGSNSQVNLLNKERNYLTNFLQRNVGIIDEYAENCRLIFSTIMPAVSCRLHIPFGFNDVIDPLRFEARKPLWQKQCLCHRGMWSEYTGDSPNTQALFSSFLKKL